MTKEDPKGTCANAGCRRPPSPGERFCDSCEVEWLLYRRDLRATAGAEAEPRPARR